MKKDIKAWAIKIRNRSFYTQGDQVQLYKTRASADIVVAKIIFATAIRAEPVRVRVRIQEVS